MEIIGHKKINSFLNKSIEKNAVAHAYLFSGPVHVGKFTLALKFASKLIGDPGDLIVVGPDVSQEKNSVKIKDITVDQVRELQRILGLTSRGKARAAIIDNADRMNRTAQNALLKTLEEPNAGNVIIIVAHDTSRLLPTILSRCQKIKFGVVAENDLKRMIPDGITAGEILPLAMGRPGVLKNLLEDESALESRRKSLVSLRKIFSQSASEKFALAEEMSEDMDKAMEQLSYWIFFLREALLGREKYVRVAKAKSFELIQSIEEGMVKIKNTNSNARLILENLFLTF